MTYGKQSPLENHGRKTKYLFNILSYATDAFCSWRRHKDLNDHLKPSLACKIFDSMISPILTYNNEVCGAFVKSDFKSWDSFAIEKTHLQLDWFISTQQGIEHCM